MREEADIFKALANVPGVELRSLLVRRVPLAAMLEREELNFLFMAGRPYRFNPAGVGCVYFAENEAVARAEYLRHQPAAQQPCVTFFAEVELHRVLDLCAQETRELVGLSLGEMRVSWTNSPKPTLAQLLGLAVSRQTEFSAIRFPSDAARAAGFAGFNVVLFRECVRRPDFVRILGPTKKPLQKWP